jgi:hypothetical protein
MISERDDDPLTRRIIECALDLHAELGPGFLEQARREARLIEARLRDTEANGID